MAYTVGVVMFDLAGFYASSLPTLVAVANSPIGIPSAAATATPAAFSLTFPALSNPPPPPGTMLVTDPGGPGDFFRSGVLAAWPTAPASIVAGTTAAPLTYAALTAGITTPISIGIDWYIGVAIGAATGFMFSPFNLKLTSVVIAPSSTPGAIRAIFRGIISFFTLFIPRRTDIAGSVDLTLSPSGDAAVAANIVAVSASNLSLSPGFITPLSTPLLALLAPAFSGALSGPLTTRVNTALAPVVAAAKAMIPTTPAGTPLFSAAATVSARRITVLRSGVIVQAILSELIATPPAAPAPGPGTTAPAAEPQLSVTIDPPPDFDVVQTYVVRVRRQSDLTAVDAASVTIVTYLPITGASVTVSGQTNAQGLVALDAALATRSRPSQDPTHAGRFDVTWPSLTVTKTGFATYRQDLGR